MLSTRECFSKAESYLLDSLPPPSFIKSRQKELMWRWARHGYFEALLASAYFSQNPEDLHKDQAHYPSLELEDVLVGLIVHDALGKSNVSDVGIWDLAWYQLSLRERQDMRNHNLIGSRVAYFHDSMSHNKLSKVGHDIVRFHHEKLDGSGPLHLTANLIPYVVQCAIVFDQIISRCQSKPYHSKKHSLKTAYEQVNSRANTHFNGDVLKRLSILFSDNKHLTQPGLHWLGTFS